MGTGLAIVCGQLGHPFVAVMSRGNSPERARMMAALGAEVLLVGQAPGARPGEVSGADLDLVEAEAARITTERGAFRADQFVRHGNPAAHEAGTGPELWRDSGGTLTAFVDFAGSGGTFAGTLRALRQRSEIRGYIAEPEGAAALAGCTVTSGSHPIQGGGYGKPSLAFLDDVRVDGYLAVTGQDARDTARALAREEGIFGGYSAGANVRAALDLLAGPEAGGVIGVLICDSGLKYLSTELWADGPS